MPVATFLRSSTTFFNRRRVSYGTGLSINHITPFQADSHSWAECSVLPSFYMHIFSLGEADLKYQDRGPLFSRLVMDIRQHFVSPVDNVSHNNVKSEAAPYMVVRFNMHYGPFEDGDD